MRFLLVFALMVAVGALATGQDTKSSPDRQISESLRDVHDRGADLYNAGDPTAGYRMYQGGLIVARGLLGHRPELQKMIVDGLANADNQPSVNRRAFMLHELIEKVRAELKVKAKKAGEPLAVPPREVKPGTRPPAGVGEVSSGVLGRVVWNGQPVAGVDVIFVTLGRLNPRVFEATTGAQGVYAIAAVDPGKYIVLIVPGPKASVRKLPERYATTTTSPLVIDVKAKGEKLDFILQ